MPGSPSGHSAPATARRPDAARSSSSGPQRRTDPGSPLTSSPALHSCLTAAEPVCKHSSIAVVIEILRGVSICTCREQDTVGDMSRDQVSAALERQLKRSKGDAGGNGNSNGEVSAVEE